MTLSYDLHILEETQSTNEDAKVAACAGAAEGAVFQAWRQTSGKGRQGRLWTSPEGNLYISLILRPEIEPHEVGFYAFATALAVYDTIRAVLPQAKIEVKWPNDVLLEGKKISGILLETVLNRTGQVEALVVGTGINIFLFPENPLYPTTSLSQEGAFVSNLSPTAAREKIGLVRELYLKNFSLWVDVLRQNGFGPLRLSWLKYAKKGAMRVRNGEKGDFIGTFVDLDPDGYLILSLADGTLRRISSGDIFFG